MRLISVERAPRGAITWRQRILAVLLLAALMACLPDAKLFGLPSFGSVARGW
jgi:hypothetical protein